MLFTLPEVVYPNTSKQDKIVPYYLWYWLEYYMLYAHILLII